MHVRTLILCSAFVVRCLEFIGMLLLGLLVVCKFGESMRIPELNDGTLSCAKMDAKTKKNNTGCINNTWLCEPEKCPKKYVRNGCVTMYVNTSGELKPAWMGCLDIDPFRGCGMESCPLKLHNGHFSCCCFGNMCNYNTTMTMVEPVAITPTDSPQQAKRGSRSLTNDNMLLVYILAPLFSFFIIAGILAHFLKRRKDSIRREHDHLLEPQQTHSPIMHCRPIQLLVNIHSGQFATVSKAIYQHKIVAVKDIHPSHEELWANERHIYEKCNLDHANILQFIGAEKRCSGSAVQYWIITEYCDNGCLADYLQKYTITISEMIRMTLDILKGIIYLHSSSSHHPMIAHRDLKSSNIFVKSDLTCCLGDFGLSISFTPESTDLSYEMAQVGTKRYMAPEVLRGAISYTPECFFSIDMYAFALVCWELLSRCGFSPDLPDPYLAPYSREVGSHPSLEDMIRCVIEENKRPELKEEWRSHEILGIFCETVEECWDVDAYARVAASLAFLRLSKVSLPKAASAEKFSDTKTETETLESNDESSQGITVLLDKENVIL